jgi:hypothetical protein
MFTAIIPLLYFAASAFISLVALNSAQSIRPVLYVLLNACGLLAFSRLRDLPFDAMITGVLGLFVLVWLTYIFCVLLLEKHRIPQTQNAVSFNWHGAYKMCCNPRWVGTSKTTAEANSKSSTPRPAEKGGSFTRVPRKAFLLRRTCSVVTLFVLSRLVGFALSNLGSFAIQPLHHSDFAPAKEIYFRRLFHGSVTLRETAIRAVLAFMWIWPNFATLTAIHDVLALFFVGVLGLDEPEEWPAFFGSPSEAYSVRQFWAKFWHRCVYRTYLAFAIPFSEKVLRLRQRSMPGQLVINFIVFLISGIMHALVTRQMGYRCGAWRDVWWFCANFEAIAAETLLQQLLETLFPQRRGGSKTTVPVLERALGFLWVFAFFFWSVPKWQYPKVHCGQTPA